MGKYLITGFSGFVSSHFLTYLNNNTKANILGIDLASPKFRLDYFKNIRCDFRQIDLLDINQAKKLISGFQPDYILHLASYSSVAFSWKNPITSFMNNTNIFINLLEIVRELNIKCRILSIGSSEEYGNVYVKELPLKESQQLNPLNPYAVARVAQEMMSKVYADGYGTDIIMTRSFNHIGPLQPDTYVVASFARQLMEQKNLGCSKCKLIAGDVSIIRDFIDVRDVVEAYYKLFQKGRKGEVYNVCSGKGVKLKEVIEIMAHNMGIEVEIQTNRELIRPSDNKIIIGSNEKIIRETGFDIRYSLEQSLNDMLFYKNS